LAILWVGNAVSVIPFFIFARYRLPGVPAMIVSAAFFLGSFYDCLRERSYRAVAASLAAFLAIFLLCRAADVAGAPGQVASASWINLGEEYRRLGDWNKADRAFHSALETSPDDVLVLNSLGVSLLQQGRLEEAAAAFGRALQIQPDYAKARFNLGFVRETEGRDAAAIQEYRAALALSPSLDAAKLNMAGLLAKGGRTGEAERLYREILADEPGNATAAYDLGLLFLDKDASTALTEFRRALEINPRYGKAYDGQGVALSHLKDAHGAEASFQAALSIDPNDVTARKNLELLSVPTMSPTHK
jgi:Tfp pilus assembly protein PilF